ITTLLEENGVDLEDGRILDFGCQEGTSVDSLRKAGLDAYGFDLGEPCSEGIIRRSTIQNYQIPWPADTFDAIYSHHVFEHVGNHNTALSELHRVLKPGGVMVHIFPSRWRVFEAHFYTPFGGVFN